MSSEQVPFNNPQITNNQNPLAMPGNIHPNNNISNKFSLRFLIITNIISGFIGLGFHYLLMNHSILEQHEGGKMWVQTGGDPCIECTNLAANCHQCDSAEMGCNTYCYTATDQAACLEADDTWCPSFL